MSRLEEYLRAWQRLSPSRPPALAGVSAIPFSEIVAYWREFGSGEAEDREEFFHLVEALDDEFRAWHAKKQALNKSGRFQVPKP